MRELCAGMRAITSLACLKDTNSATWPFSRVTTWNIVTFSKRTKSSTWTQTGSESPTSNCARYNFRSYYLSLEQIRNHECIKRRATCFKNYFCRPFCCLCCILARTVVDAVIEGKIRALVCEMSDRAYTMLLWKIKPSNVSPKCVILHAHTHKFTMHARYVVTSSTKVRVRLIG